MATISVQQNTGSCNAVIVGFNISYGNDAQPIYEAGQKNISCVVEIEAMAQVSIQKALFKEGQYTTEVSAINLAKVPSLTLQDAVVKYGYSASSGQAYVVEDLTIIGRKSN